MITIDYNSKKQKATITGDCVDLIREHFSIANPAAKFSRNRKFIPKRLYSITPTGQFDIGLVGEIRDVIKQKNIDTDIVLTELAQQAYSPSLPYDVKCIENPKYTLRDYQQETIEALMQNGRGVAVLGTGAGKTLTTATLLESIHRHKPRFKCLIIVPDLGLVKQTYGDFADYGPSFTFTKWSGKMLPDLGCNVVIANSDIIRNRFDENDWIQHVDVLVVDEVHKANHGTSLSKILQKIYTLHKFGFTGTLPESNQDRWNILGKIGPVLFEKDSSELRAGGFLTNVHIKIIKLDYITNQKVTVSSDTPTLAYMQELEFLETNAFRNRVIKKICDNYKQNTLVLVNHISHGEILTEVLSQLTDRRVFFIRGDVDVEERERVRSMMEQDNDIICVAISKIFSTGVNIKNLHMILFAAGGKSFIRTVQTIGRGLRLHPTKTELVIVDIADQLKYGTEHANKRQEIYQRQNIDFSFHSLTEK